MDELTKVLIMAGSSLLAAILTVVLRDYLESRREKKQKEKDENINMTDIEEMVQVQEWLDGLREKHEFDRVSIFQFHNGGKYFQGKSMKKFSMTYESVAPGYEKVKRAHQNILASEYPKWISEMVNKECFAVLTGQLDLKDRHELEQMGVQQFVTVPIYCIKKKLIGFIVGYNIAEEDEKIEEKFDSLVEDSKFISGYLS